MSKLGDLLRRLTGKSSAPKEPDEFGVRQMSDRDLAHQLAAGKMLLSHSKVTKTVIDFHSDPERQKYWKDRFEENTKQVGDKVSALEAEMSRRLSSD